MCGFCGFTGTVAGDKQVLFNMMEKIIHRGPDSFGHHMDENISLGFRRLSIIDLSESGSQPMYNEDKSVVIVFNGEIYNYKPLKEELRKKGHVFLSDADTEVLIHAYEEYGFDMLNKLRGMFAFAIWDEKAGRLFCARDFFGIKPFYYTIADENIIFASEIKSILAHPSYKKALNEEALENYLSFQYSPLEETFFKEIYKLPPAHYLIYEKGKFKTVRYFSPAFLEKETSLNACVEEIDASIQNSIDAHKVSDVEVGSFLSSGIDSSYVAACFHGDKTFTVGFDYDKYNEIEYAKQLSEKIEIANYSKLISTEEYWEVIPKVQYHMDEPLADPSAIALYFVSQLASQYVKVTLSGEGADELFGGYNIYKEPISLALYTKLPLFLRKFFEQAVQLLPFSFKGKSFLIRGSKTVEERFIGNSYMFSIHERSKILKNPKFHYPPTEVTKSFYEKVKDKDDITKMQYLDIHLWLTGDILLKADKMSMAHSLELRVPFLDKEVFKTAALIPLKYRVNKENTKYALRKAAARYIPNQVAEKKKLGFPVPIRIWLREQTYYQLVLSYFENDAAEKYFNVNQLKKLLSDHYAGKKDNSRKIWTIFIFLIWYKQFFE